MLKWPENSVFWAKKPFSGFFSMTPVLEYIPKVVLINGTDPQTDVSFQAPF